MGFFGQTIIPNAFPAPSGSERYFFPSKGGLAVGSTAPTRNTISYFPFFIKKTTASLRLCVEQVANSAINTCEVGIYSALDGLPSASRIESGTITTTNSLGIFTYTVTTNISVGWYIIAGILTSVSTTTFRTFTSNFLISEDFGRDVGDTTIDTNYFYTQTGLTSLPTNIGTITRSSTNVGLNVFVRY